MPIFPVSDEKKPQKTLTPISSMKKTSSSNDHFNMDDTKPEVLPPKKTPSFGDPNKKITEEIKPAIPEPKLAPHPSRKMMPPHQPPPPLLPPPPPPPPQPPRLQPRPPTPPTRMNTNDKKAAAWEREQLEAIKEKYINGYIVTLHSLNINWQASS